MINGIPEEVECAEPSTKRRRVCRQFGYLLLGLFLNFSAFAAVFNLQTSINIENGLGVTSIATTYLVSIIFGILLTPVLLRRHGAKRCIIAAEVFYAVYIAANLYPAYYTLVPAGIMMGFSEATIWPAISMMCVYFASQYTEFSKKSKNFHVGLFMGYFYTTFQATQVFGNLVSYAVLYGLDQTAHKPSNDTVNNCTAAVCDVDKYSFCGSRDCQDSSVVDDTLTQYKPGQQMTLHILIGILLIFIMTAIAIHIILVPEIGSFVSNFETDEITMKPAVTEHGDTVPVVTLAAVSADAVSPLVETMPQLDDSTPCDISVELQSNKPSRFCCCTLHTGSCTLATTTMMSIFKHLTQKKQLLMLPIAFYNGYAMAFAMGELTRAYVSCVLGVHWVGICMAMYGTSDCIMSWFSGRFGRRFGYAKLYIAIFVVELCNYIYCLLWIPSMTTSWSLFVVSFTFGFADGMTQTIVNVAHIDFFPANQEVALSVWNTTIILGFAVQFSCSVALCVSTKIYINIFYLLVGVMGAIGAEHYHQKKL